MLERLADFFEQAAGAAGQPGRGLLLSNRISVCSQSMVGAVLAANRNVTVLRLGDGAWVDTDLKVANLQGVPLFEEEEPIRSATKLSLSKI